MVLPRRSLRRSTRHFLPRPAMLRKSRTPFCGLSRLLRERGSWGISSAPKTSVSTRSTPSQNKCKPSCWKPLALLPTPNSSKAKRSAPSSSSMQEHHFEGSANKRFAFEWRSLPEVSSEDSSGRSKKRLLVRSRAVWRSGVEFPTWRVTGYKDRPQSWCNDAVRRSFFTLRVALLSHRSGRDRTQHALVALL